VRNNAPSTQALAVIAALEGATVEGLNAQNFDAGLWQARIANLHRGALSAAQFDLELTVSAMRYASCLRFGCVNPHPSPEGFDLAAWVGGTLAASNDAAAALQQLEPPSEEYRRLKAALANYERIAWDDTGEKLPDSKKPVEPGQPYAGVTRLVALLRRTGDLPPDTQVAAQVQDSGVYGGALVDAVKRFQARHGLECDGRLGSATFEALNTPLVARLQQLQLALERVRWLPRVVSQPSIVVNIPEFRLRALDASGKTELQMKVVVGKAQDLQTPDFSADMKRVIFRPYWNVPLSIQAKELIPEIQKDPSYLSKNDYEVTDSSGKVVSSGVVSREIMAGLRSGKLQIRQRPGPKNALGNVKFVLPNENDVYFHDTPSRRLFARSRRDFSHGCIRLENPRELAFWVLHDRPEWTRERVQAAIEGDDTIEVSLPQPIPVRIEYRTAAADDGSVSFFDDIYGLDEALEEQLTNGGFGPRPRG
jgi:murein L,D-transpeptidase YcbB/YkuD